MTIQYLKKMASTPLNKLDRAYVISESKIQQLEQLSGVQLPRAYKEYLYLRGEHGGFLDWYIGSDIYDLVDLQEMTVETLSDVGYTMPKPFWNFADQDNGDVFLFFFLDEGDNPPVYYCDRSTYGINRKPEADYKKYYETFSDCINQYIQWRRDGTI